MSPRANVYILGFPNGKCYVGITSRTVEKRLRKHVVATLAGSKYAVHCALRKYGPENVKLIAVITGVPWGQATDLEVWWISRLDTFKGPGYNMTAGGDGAVGYRHTTRTKTKLSNIHKGRKLTAEHIAKLTSYRHTDEAKAKISKAGMGRKLTAEAKARISKAKMGNNHNRGRKYTDEHRANISTAKKGYKHTAEAKAKMSKARKGRKLTAEHKANIGKAGKGRKLSPEAILKREKIIAETIGKTFGRWSVLGYNEKESKCRGMLMLNCCCTCGKEKPVLSSNLRTGESKGCQSCASRGRRAQTLRHCEAAKENYVTTS